MLVNPIFFYQQDFLRNMEVRPLTKEFHAYYLRKKLEKKNISIKNAIMDSRIVVGVGNIYASERLFHSKINPMKLAGKLHYKELTRLVKSIKFVLIKAIQKGGKTLKDFVNGDNKPGYFQQELKVYNRYGMACNSCESFIHKINQAGRSSFFCPNCQRFDDDIASKVSFLFHQELYSHRKRLEYVKID